MLGAKLVITTTTTTAMTTQPLLSVGAYGVHVICTNDVWSFTGTVPASIKRGPYKTRKHAVDTFAEWFCEQDQDFIDEHMTALSNEVRDLLIVAF